MKNEMINKKERNKIILKLRKKGYTYEEIGKATGLTRERIGQIIRLLERNEK